jgi:hypothetical protein
LLGAHPLKLVRGACARAGFEVDRISPALDDDDNQPPNVEG